MAEEDEEDEEEEEVILVGRGGGKEKAPHALFEVRITAQGFVRDGASRQRGRAEEQQENR